MIYNKDLLNKYFQRGLVDHQASIDDLDGLRQRLKTVADDIQARKDELGVKGAFTSAGFDSSSDWRFKDPVWPTMPIVRTSSRTRRAPSSLPTIKGTYLPDFKQIVRPVHRRTPPSTPTELSAKTGNDATSEFALGEGVFYPERNLGVE